MAIFDQKLTKNDQKSTFFHVFENYVCRIAPCVFRCKPVKSGWEKPANLYSTKCRIFGTSRTPSAGAAPWWLTTLPADHPPHPPVGPVRSSRSKIVPARFFSKKFFFKKKFFLIFFAEFSAFLNFNFLKYFYFYKFINFRKKNLKKYFFFLGKIFLTKNIFLYEIKKIIFFIKFSRFWPQNALHFYIFLKK